MRGRLRLPNIQGKSMDRVIKEALGETTPTPAPNPVTKIWNARPPVMPRSPFAPRLNIYAAPGYTQGQPQDFASLDELTAKPKKKKNKVESTILDPLLDDDGDI